MTIENKEIQENVELCWFCQSEKASVASNAKFRITKLFARRDRYGNVIRDLHLNIPTKKMSIPRCIKCKKDWRNVMYYSLLLSAFLSFFTHVFIVRHLLKNSDDAVTIISSVLFVVPIFLFTWDQLKYRYFTERNSLYNFPPILELEKKIEDEKHF